jgi:hypothetical protein
VGAASGGGSSFGRGATAGGGAAVGCVAQLAINNNVTTLTRAACMRPGVFT